MKSNAPSPSLSARRLLIVSNRLPVTINIESAPKSSSPVAFAATASTPPFSVKVDNSNQVTFSFKPSSGGLVSALNGLTSHSSPYSSASASASSSAASSPTTAASPALAGSSSSAPLFNSMLWIGWIGGSVASHLRSSLTTLLRKQHCVPVYIEQDLCDRYYNGFCNRVLWPIFHYMSPFSSSSSVATSSDDETMRQVFEEWYPAYHQVNQLFAEVIWSIYKPGDIVWIHDYHLILVPHMLRKKQQLHWQHLQRQQEKQSLRVPPSSLPSPSPSPLSPSPAPSSSSFSSSSMFQPMTLGFFLHIPFPADEIFRTCPARSNLLHALLTNDLIGFHTRDYQGHFQSSCSRLLGLNSTLDQRIVTDSYSCQIGTFPIGIDPDRFLNAIQKSDVKAFLRELYAQFHDQERVLILGIDRLDTIKGVPHKLLAFEHFLEQHPEWRQRVVLLQVAVPSREDVKEYKQLKKQVHTLVGRINGKFGSVFSGNRGGGSMGGVVSSGPVYYLDQSVSFDRMCALYRAADVLFVTSLRDGMNLVALEYVVCQQGQAGRLLLSEFAGAYQSLGGFGAIRVNPWNLQECSESLLQALMMSENEAKKRQEQMLQYVLTHTAEHWASQFVSTLTKMEDEKNQARIGQQQQQQKQEDSLFQPSSAVCLSSASKFHTIFDQDMKTEEDGSEEESNLQGILSSFQQSHTRLVIVSLDDTIEHNLAMLISIKASSISATPPTPSTSNNSDVAATSRTHLVNQTLDPALVASLTQLALDPSIVLVVTSSRTRAEMDVLVAQVPKNGGLWLIAESGFYIRVPKLKDSSSTFTTTAPPSSSTTATPTPSAIASADNSMVSSDYEYAHEWCALYDENSHVTSWHSSVYELLQHYMERTPNSFLAKNDTFLSWYYYEAYDAHPREPTSLPPPASNNKNNNTTNDMTITSPSQPVHTFSPVPFSFLQANAVLSHLSGPSFTSAPMQIIHTHHVYSLPTSVLQLPKINPSSAPSSILSSPSFRMDDLSMIRIQPVGVSVGHALKYLLSHYQQRMILLNSMRSAGRAGAALSPSQLSPTIPASSLSSSAAATLNSPTIGRSTIASTQLCSDDELTMPPPLTTASATSSLFSHASASVASPSNLTTAVPTSTTPTLMHIHRSIALSFRHNSEDDFLSMMHEEMEAAATSNASTTASTPGDAQPEERPLGSELLLLPTSASLAKHFSSPIIPSRKHGIDTANVIPTSSNSTITSKMFDYILCVGNFIDEYVACEQQVQRRQQQQWRLSAAAATGKSVAASDAVLSVVSSEAALLAPIASTAGISASIPVADSSDIFSFLANYSHTYSLLSSSTSLSASSSASSLLSSVGMAPFPSSFLTTSKGVGVGMCEGTGLAREENINPGGSLSDFFQVNDSGRNSRGGNTGEPSPTLTTHSLLNLQALTTALPQHLVIDCVFVGMVGNDEATNEEEDDDASDMLSRRNNMNDDRRRQLGDTTTFTTSPHPAEHSSDTAQQPLLSTSFFSSSLLLLLPRSLRTIVTCIPATRTYRRNFLQRRIDIHTLLHIVAQLAQQPSSSSTSSSLSLSLSSSLATPAPVA